MRFLKTIPALALISLLAGCLPVETIHPLFIDKDVVFDPSILGVWIAQGDQVGNHDRDRDSHWTIEQSGDRAYRFTFTSPKEDSSLTYDVRLVRLHDFLFVDALLRDVCHKGEGDMGLEGLGRVTAHVFGRIFVKGDSLRLAMLDHEWLKTAIAENRVEIRHETIGDTIVLTASTLELQNFALKYADDQHAFAVDLKLARRK